MESLSWCEKIKGGNYSDWLLYKDKHKIKYHKELDHLVFHSMGKELFEKGYVVFPVFTNEESDQLVLEFLQTETEFREYKHIPKMGTKEHPFVLGGFGAYGNPSSFHNLLVRKFRKKKIEYIPILGEMLECAQKNNKISNAREYKVCIFMDRMCKRIKGTSTTKESYHRDLLPKGRLHDVSIGGWIQLSKDVSQFSCVPHTHSFDLITSQKGFARENKTCTVQVSVPQGHMILFFQNLGHCVHSVTQKTDSLRIFSVYLLTKQNSHIYDFSKVISHQGVPHLASNQIPWMYSPNHGSFWLDKITIPWSKSVFKDKVLVEKTRKKDETKYTIVESPMKSLLEYGFVLYPAYQEWEKKLFIPSQKFLIGKNEWCLFYEPNNILVHQ